MTRNKGCLIFGILWAAVFIFTLFGAALGHPDPGGVRWFDYMLLGELVLLVGVGWFFYRRRMKDGGF